MARKVGQVIAQRPPDDRALHWPELLATARIMPAVGATAEKSVALVHAQGSTVAAMTMEYQ
jgi:hypothetical protein